MLKNLRRVFEQHIAAFADEPEAAHSLEIAAAALLMEISRADTEVSEVEVTAIRKAIVEVFHLADDEIADIIDNAEQVVEEAVSLFDFTAVINEQFSRDQKVRLLELLWSVAYADQELDHYEEYYVRKIADLLHIGHRDYIRTKHRVMPDNDSAGN